MSKKQSGKTPVKAQAPQQAPANPVPAPAQGTYPITGIKDGCGQDGSVPLRYELNKFVDPKFNTYAKDQLNLFLLALERIQAAPPSERTSWYQIAGIHGQPFIDWDGASSTIDPGGRLWNGYCTHSSILFPTWHRVFQALTEQAVHEYMKEVAKEFSAEQQKDLQPALDNWRFPYWDWALVTEVNGNKRIVMPELLKSEKVSVLRPSGQTAEIDNPLYRYRFPVDEKGIVLGIQDSGVPISRTPFTVRHPQQFQRDMDFAQQTTWSQGISDNNGVEEVLNLGLGSGLQGGRQLVADVYSLFARMRAFPPFSNTGWTGTGRIGDYHSLEGVHNNVHVFIGGTTSGHMALNDVAAFDPVFWLHHGNVERLLCTFQALNPEDYKDWPNDPWLSATKQPWFAGIDQLDSQGTWTEAPGIRETTTTPLTPFHKDTSGTFWDSDSVKSWKTLGYSFEELQDWLPQYQKDGKFDAPAFCRDIRAGLNEKYGWAVPSAPRIGRVLRRISAGASAGGGKASSSVSTKKTTVPAAPTQKIGMPSKPKAPQPTQPAQASQDEVHFSEYVVNVRVDRFAIKGHTFIVHIFLGDVPENPLKWAWSEVQVGVVSVFGGGLFEQDRCSNCKDQSEGDARLMTGQLSITSSLLDIIESGTEFNGISLKSLDKEEVGPFLHKNLHWRVSTLGCIEHKREEIESLCVSVAATKATIPKAAHDFIHYGEFEVLEHPTSGRLGGFDAEKHTL